MPSFFYHPNKTFTLADYKITVIRISKGPITDSIPSHRHGYDSYEIHYCTQGSGSIILENKTIKQKVGTLVVTGPNIVHSQTTDSEQLFEEFCINLRIIPLRKQADQRLATLASLVINNAPIILILLRKMEAELQQRTVFFEEELLCLLQSLLIFLLRQVDDSAISSTKEQPQTMALLDRSLKMDQYFLACPKDASIKDLATHLNLSIRQTQRALMHQYKQSFQEKNEESKLNKALILLSETQLTMSDLAEQLGFSSTAYFSQFFKKQVGISPSAYRKQKKN